MGKRAEANLKKRFGDPPRIIMKFDDKPLDGAERKYRNERIVDAVKGVLKSLLGRDPTEKELLGKIDISKALKKGLKGGKTSQKAKKPALDFQI